MTGRHVTVTRDLLEDAWMSGDEPRCEASVDPGPNFQPGHTCTVTARWVTHNYHGMTRLWCDGRYQVYLDGLAIHRLCSRCDQLTSHWTVIPL